MDSVTQLRRHDFSINLARADEQHKHTFFHGQTDLPFILDGLTPLTIQVAFAFNEEGVVEIALLHKAVILSLKVRSPCAYAHVRPRSVRKHTVIITVWI